MCLCHTLWSLDKEDFHKALEGVAVSSSPKQVMPIPRPPVESFRDFLLILQMQKKFRQQESMPASKISRQVRAPKACIATLRARKVSAGACLALFLRLERAPVLITAQALRGKVSLVVYHKKKFLKKNSYFDKKNKQRHSDNCVRAGRVGFSQNGSHMFYWENKSSGK